VKQPTYRGGNQCYFTQRTNDRCDYYPLTTKQNPQRTVDGTNPAPLRMAQMLVLDQYQDLLGRPKWCRIFSIKWKQNL